MKQEEIEQKINEYAKEVSLHIIKQYRDNLGLQNVLLLDKIGNELKISFTPYKKDTIYLSFPEETNSSDIIFEILKRQIPYLLFSLVIDIKKNLSISKDEEECINELENGLRKIYTTRFCSQYHYVEESPFVDTQIARMLLNMNAEDINLDNMVFQTNYDYMKQIYFISTGKNLLREYERLKNKQDKSRNLVMEKKKSNGYFNGILLLLCALISGMFLSFCFFS